MSTDNRKILGGGGSTSEPEDAALNEKALENVSGGLEQSGVKNFARKNCHHCRRNLDGTCPYSSESEAFEILGRNAGCPEKKDLW